MLILVTRITEPATRITESKIVVCDMRRCEKIDNPSYCCRIGTFSVEQRVFKTQSCNITLSDRNIFYSLGTFWQDPDFLSLPRQSNESRIIMSQVVDGGVVLQSEFMIV